MSTVNSRRRTATEPHVGGSATSLGTTYRRVVPPHGVGQPALRPDGAAKVRGAFAFSSDLHAEGMLWGATTRSPHAHARIAAIDVAEAVSMAGVHAVLTIEDVPGRRVFGLEIPDQPVLADGMVRYWSEPVALVAAVDPETARRAAATVRVRYEPLDPLLDPEEAERRGETFHRIRIRRGDQALRGEVVVEGTYQVGMQDQAPLGTESGLAVPDGQGGVDLYVSTQDIFTDHRQVAASLGLPDDRVRVHLAGVGGAFGAREDVTLQIHLALLAMRTGRPVKIVYGRAESFSGHVHRHPAKLWYRHQADREGNLVRVEARILVDGGAYQSTSAPVISNASYFSVGPYRCPSVSVDGVAVRTNNPPCGAMRGFGTVQACFGHESQMDALAAALGMDQVEIRLRNALRPGDPVATTGQVPPEPLPVEEVIRSVAAIPLPDVPTTDDPLTLPGGASNTSRRSDVRRGVGYGVGFKNLAFGGGVDDFAEARVTLTADGVEVETAAAEIGQGIVTVCEQIARTVLGIDRVRVVLADTSRIGPAFSSSASRQTQMTGGAVAEAARQVRETALARVMADDLDGRGAWRGDRFVATLEELVAGDPISATVRFHHPPTESPDGDGQGRIHAGFCLAAHRAVVDVDLELGLVRVVRVDTAQDVGRAINPLAVMGQIEGGIAQGLGLAVMEELVVREGRIENPSFTDYLIPTILDAPEVEAVLIEEASVWGPFGAKGVGEPPTISSPAAIAAAIRAATGRAVTRLPVRPDDLVWPRCVSKPSPAELGP
jgi:xanthine dehydrogenase D subunit